MAVLFPADLKHDNKIFVYDLDATMRLVAFLGLVPPLKAIGSRILKGEFDPGHSFGADTGEGVVARVHAFEEGVVKFSPFKENGKAIMRHDGAIAVLRHEMSAIGRLVGELE